VACCRGVGAVAELPCRLYSVQPLRFDKIPSPIMKYTLEIEIEQPREKVVELFDDTEIGSGGRSVYPETMRLIALIIPGCFKKQSLKYMTNFKAFAETGAEVRESGQGA